MAVTVSFGKCAECNENNAMNTSVCRKCNADLPWSKKKKAAVKAASATVVQKQRTQSHNNVAVKSRMPEIDGMLLFMVFISFSFPVIGYFVWRSYAEDGSEYTAAVGWASALGLIAHILRIFARMAT